MRTLSLLALIFAAACSSSEASKPAAPTPPAPRNFVCERVAELTKDQAKKPKCEPEYDGVGDLATHTARVTPEGAKVAIVCGLNAGRLEMVCGALEQRVEAAKQEQPAQPKAKK